MTITNKGIFRPIEISEIGPANGLVAWYPLDGMLMITSMEIMVWLMVL